jgi:molybdenum cofactor synthesis domain-containing protein
VLENYIEAGTDLIITTGGTGISPRDITPETVRPILDKELPGIMEWIRNKHAEKNPNALLSRSVAGTAGQSTIFTLPGSPRAAGEYLDEIIPLLDHIILMIHGIGH